MFHFFSFLFIAKYCKQLYLDVTNTNNGKITWNFIKPIIQGKFLYGPINPQTEKIIQNVNLSIVCVCVYFKNSNSNNSNFIHFRQMKL